MRAHRARALSPERRVCAGRRTIPIPFSRRARRQPILREVPGIVQKAMDRLAALTGRDYQLFRYAGRPKPSGSSSRSAPAVESARRDRRLAAASGGEGRRVAGSRSIGRGTASIPRRHAESAAGRSRCWSTKEVGAPGEPLYVDVISTTLAPAAAPASRRTMPAIIGGRYGLVVEGLRSGEAKAVFDELKKARAEEWLHGRYHRRRLTHQPAGRSAASTSRGPDTVRALFYGLGADGRSGQTRTRRQDPRPSPAGMRRAISSTTSEVRLADDLPLRFGRSPFSAPISSSRRTSSRAQVRLSRSRSTCSPRRRRRHGAPQQPLRPGTRSGTSCRVRCRSRSSTRGFKLHVIDASEVALSLGLGSRTNTSCRPASSRCPA